MSENTTIADQLEAKLKRAFEEISAANIAKITEELLESENGKMTVGFSIKLSLNNGRVAGVGGLSYSRKFTDEIEFITDDPKQGNLPIDNGGAR